MLTLTAEDARTRILAGEAIAEAFRVEGDLTLSGAQDLRELPATLKECWGLHLSGCPNLTHLPAGMSVHRLTITNCPALHTLPPGLTAYSLTAHNADLTHLPDDLTVQFKLDLRGSTSLRSLPDGLRLGTLNVSGCTTLEALPDDLHFYFLDAKDCASLKTWGANGTVEVGRIVLRNCRQLAALPNWLGTIAELDVQGCTSLTELPANLSVTGDLEIAESGLTALPRGCMQADLRWRGVRIKPSIAFHPESITAQAVIETQNIELRRVMLERMGYEAFFKQANAKELDRDADPGGVRRLLRVDFKDESRWRRDEPLVCLSVTCPSTARHYIIRVPPDMDSCHQAAAWIAGFDDPALYRPLQET